MGLLQQCSVESYHFSKMDWRYSIVYLVAKPVCLCLCYRVTSSWQQEAGICRESWRNRSHDTVHYGFYIGIERFNDVQYCVIFTYLYVIIFCMCVLLRLNITLKNEWMIEWRLCHTYCAVPYLVMEMKLSLCSLCEYQYKYSQKRKTKVSRTYS